MFPSVLFILNIIISSLFANTLQGNDIRNHLGTRTPYRFKFNKNDSRISFPVMAGTIARLRFLWPHDLKADLYRSLRIKTKSCKEQKIWMVLRHGTRLPSSEDIIGMNTKLKDLRNEVLLHNAQKQGSLGQEQLELFENWNTVATVEEEKDLTYEGQDEMILTAERMQRRFPTIMIEEYDNKIYQFRYTATQRTHQSARYFSIGLFDEKSIHNVTFAPALKIDTTLRFYKHCDKWQKQVKKNPDTYKEQLLFGTSQRMNNTLESVSIRLGLDRVLTLDEVVLMYKICGFETSWHKYFESPWCYAFDIDTIKNLEYYHDLKHYWLDAYGHELTYYQACMILKDMFKLMSNDEDPRASFLFAHSGTLLKLLTHLGLYRPAAHLTAAVVDDNRAWKTTDIDCFASNVAFVLFQCSDGDRILTLHQERIIKLPMCDDELCPLEHLRTYFHDSIHNCDFTEMCSID